MQNIEDNRKCFVCGELNQRGLRFKFIHHPERKQVEAAITFPEFYQGWEGVIHGGLISTILDEIMVQATMAREIPTVTAEMTVTFKKPAVPDETYLAVGKMTEIRHRFIMAESHIQDKEGNILASATGKLFIVK